MLGLKDADSAIREEQHRVQYASVSSGAHARENNILAEGVSVVSMSRSV